MDRRERYENLHDALLASFQGQQADLWTALPGIIQSFDPSNLTCTIQPALRAQVTSSVDGSTSWINLPLLVDCPVYFPAGGGCTLTFPIVKGDECLVIFASRCIDAWWQSGGVQQQAVLRMHDLSDGFAFVGVRSVPRALTAFSTTSVQLRSDDGAAFVEINPSSHLINANTSGKITATAGSDITATAGGNATINATGNVAATAGANLTANASGSATVTAPSIVLNGNVTVNGTLSQIGGGISSFSGNITGQGTLVTTGDITGQGTSLHTHIHSGVQTGASNTGAPV